MSRWPCLYVALLATGGWLLPAVACAAEPSVTECLAASDASLKLDNDHKLRGEREQLLICAAESCPPDIRQECAKRVDQVNQALPSIVFDVKDAAGNDLSAVKVTMDGEVIAERLIGTAIALDPGEHQFVFEVAGQAPLTRQLVIRVSEQNRRENVVFMQLNAAPAPAPARATPPATPAPLAPQPPLSHPATSLSGLRMAAIVAGGVGVVGVAIGGVLGLEAMRQKNTAKNDCPNATCPTQAGSDEWSSAKSSAKFSTVAFIVGGVGLAGAATLWFTSGSRADRPQVGLGLGGIQLKGNW